MIRAVLVAAIAFTMGAVAAAARAEAPIGVRFGSHPGFERVVLDWPERVEYRVATEGSDVAIEFARDGRIDAGRLVERLAGVATAATASSEKGRVTLRLALAEGVTLKHSRNGSRVVLDLHRVADAPVADARTAKALQAIRPAAGPAPSNNKKPAAAPPAPAAEAAPTPLVPPVVAAPSPPPPPPPTAPMVGPLPARGSDTAGLPSVGVEVNAIAAGWRLRFNWKEPVGAAVFARGSTLWIVFDRRALLGGSQLAQRRADLGAVDVALIDGATPGAALRLAPAAGTRAQVSRDGDAWIVEIGSRVAPPVQKLDIVVRGGVDGEKPRVSVVLPGASSVMRLRDPEVGDELYVLPTQAPSAGVPETREFAPFRVLASAQGVVVQPLSERVIARPTGESVELSDPQLAVSDPAAITLATVPLAQRRAPLFDFARWQRGGAKTYTEDLQALRQAVAAAKSAERAAARLALARFHLAHEQAVDALALLRMIEADQPAVATEPANRALRGVAALLAGDLDDAERHLAHPALAASAEAALWRGLLRLAQDEPQRALDPLTQGLELAEKYPPRFRNRVALAHAAALIAAEEPDAALRALDGVAQRAPTEAEERRRRLLRGHVLALKGDRAAADALWADLENAQPSPVRTEATQARIDLLLEDRKLAPAEAIVRLERLRFAWRGDGLEFRTLARLGQLQVEQDNLRAGLMSWREAATQFPNHVRTPGLVADMGHAFARLYLDGDADKLPPLQAIAVFEEFRELVPAGARGDAMVRRLAERLIALDLLDRAGDLLEHQVKSRLAGPEKSEVATRLALIRLMDRKPEAALAALRDGAAGDLPPELRRDRARLEARARADLGDPRGALGLIAEDAAPEAELLRAEILMNAGDWPGVATALGRLAGEPPAAGEALADASQRLVLHRAVALALAGDAAGLADLRQRYGAAMEAGALKDVFRVVVAESGAVPSDIGAAAKAAAAAAPYQSFLQAYRQRVVGPSGS